MTAANGFLARLRAHSGARIGEVCPDASAADKAAASRAVNRLIGQEGIGNLHIRTLPITRGSRPREPTKVCGLDWGAVVQESWSDSSVRAVLGDIILIPILKPDTEVPRDWRIGEAFYFDVDATVRSIIADDYEGIRTIIRSGRGDDLSSAMPPGGQGVYLMPKTSGRDSADLVRYEDASGTVQVARRRGFYLRQQLTSSLLAKQLNLAQDTSVFDELMNVLAGVSSQAEGP